MNILVIDTETSGILNTDEAYTAYTSGPQVLQLGVVVSNTENYEILDSFVTKIKFQGIYRGLQYGPYPNLTWSEDAEQIHGIMPSSPGATPSSAASDFVQFVSNYFKLDSRITIAAHNPAFDVYFLRQLLFLAGMIDKVKIHHSMIDTSTIGRILYDKHGSRELFKMCSGLERETHDALEDAKAANAVLAYTNNLLKG